MRRDQLQKPPQFKIPPTASHSTGVGSTSTSSFSRSNLSQTTLKEYLKNSTSSALPTHTRPWLAPVQPPKQAASWHSALKRLADEEALAERASDKFTDRSRNNLDRSNLSVINFDRPEKSSRDKPSYSMDKPNKRTRDEEVQIVGVKRGRDEGVQIVGRSHQSKVKPTVLVPEVAPPPMFEEPSKQRRVTKLSHTKGSSPQQLMKWKGREGVHASGGVSLTQKILSLDDLHLAILRVDLDQIEQSTQVRMDEEMGELKLTYHSLNEYKQRQSQVLLTETLEGYRQSLVAGYMFEDKEKSNVMYGSCGVQLESVAKKGRDWVLLTVKRQTTDDPKGGHTTDDADQKTTDNFCIRQGDVVLMFRSDTVSGDLGSSAVSLTVEALQQYGFASPLSPQNIAATLKDAFFAGIAEKTKDPLGRGSVQIKTCLASKECPLGFGGGGIDGASWTVLVVHSLLVVEREWAALCAVKQGNRFLPFLLGEHVAGTAISRMSQEGTVRSDLGRSMSPMSGLNLSQSVAVRAAVDSSGPPICLLQGPPGTGKTQTIIAMLQLLFQRGVKKILVAAPSNAAVDDLMARLVKTVEMGRSGGTPLIVRIGRNSRSVAGQDLLAKYSLESLVDEGLKRANQERASEYRAKKQDLLGAIGELNGEIGKIAGQTTAQIDGVLPKGGATRSQLIQSKERLKQSLDLLRERNAETGNSTRDGLYKKILQSAVFVCGTLSGFGSDSVWGNLPVGSVDYCVIDEAAQSIEVSLLIPLKFEPKKLVLVGDPQQLPAVVKSAAAKRLRFDMSLLERLQLVGQLQTHLLSEQYRMHPEISRFASGFFYDGKVLDALTHVPNSSAKLCGIHFVNVNVSGDLRVGSNGGFVNPREARVVASLVRWLGLVFPNNGSSSSVGHPTIGVITPYRQQVHMIRQLLSGCRFAVEIDSVDAFQGREKDVIVFDCVRAGGDSDTVGFLSDYRRLNVAVTRAKRALWIVGNANFLRRSGGSVWAALVAYCEGLGRVVDGDQLERLLEDGKIGVNGPENGGMDIG